MCNMHEGIYPQVRHVIIFIHLFLKSSFFTPSSNTFMTIFSYIVYGNQVTAIAGSYAGTVGIVTIRCKFLYQSRRLGLAESTR